MGGEGAAIDFLFGHAQAIRTGTFRGEWWNRSSGRPAWWTRKWRSGRLADQVDDLLSEINKRAALGDRVLVTTLTKRMAENLTEYLADHGVRVRYLHSDIDTVERVEIIRDLRLGEFDVLVGINLLREGLDMPEVSLVAILDADREGFLRSDSSLIQTMGRTARNVRGKAILYADRITGSMERAMAETERRKKKQIDPTTRSTALHRKRFRKKSWISCRALTTIPHPVGAVMRAWPKPVGSMTT